MKHQLLTLIVFVLSLHSFASDHTVDLNHWAQSKEWKRLLHYKISNWGHERSLVDGPGFFFAKDGKINALAELQATIKAMNSSNLKVGALKLHPQCAFPARLHFLKTKMGLHFPITQKCEKLQEFLSKFNQPRSASIVFSSAYPNNPASMFGHSFLKFNSRNKSDLTSLGINYAARVPPDENPMAFVYFGIAGGYAGQWSTMPYHEKIKEYNQAENRDLWEYELNLSPQETILLIQHIWEIETNSFFEYYFFDENCSYHVLAAIEAIRPDWTLTDHTIYVIPGESIKNLFSQPDIVKKVHLRPSVQGKLLQKYNTLESIEKNDFFSIIEGNTVTPSASLLTIDAAIDYYQFLDIKKGGKLEKVERANQLALFSHRAKLGNRAYQKPLAPLPADTRPDKGHDSYALELSQTHRRRRDHLATGGSTQLYIKSGYHDLMNNDRGFRRFSHIDSPGIGLQYDQDLEKIQIDRINVASITSLNPMTFLSWSPSWKFSSGLYTARDYGCLSCRHVFLKSGIGATLQPFTHPTLLYGLVNGRGELYRGLNRGYRYGPGFEAGIISALSDAGKLWFAYETFWDIDQTRRTDRVDSYSMTASFYLGRNWELRFRSELIEPSGNKQFRNFENTLGLIYFFN